MTDELAWETLASAVDYSCPGFDVVRDKVRLPDGTETEFHHVDEVETVVVLPFLAETERRAGGDVDAVGGLDAADGSNTATDSDAEAVVCIEEWRQAVGRVNRGLPAGGVEPDDADLEAAAARELAEETGHEADAFEHLCTVEPVNGIADSVHHYFVARGCTPTADRDLDFDESIRVRTVRYDALVAAVRADEIRDGRTALAVSRYELASPR